jgi:2,5-diamino-6-(ribosylamino)-4(3H)-pyrimidinone 5'-phosphate reductase
MNELHARLSNFLDPLFLKRYPDGKPLVILTWAQSLDAKIAPANQTPMVLSSLETKYMTHLIRQRADAILIGAETAVTDNPSLNGVVILCNTS